MTLSGLDESQAGPKAEADPIHDLDPAAIESIRVLEDHQIQAPGWNRLIGDLAPVTELGDEVQVERCRRRSLPD